MALKDRLNDALQATEPENTVRLKTLQAVKDASGTGSDAEIQTAIANLIAVREQKAASFAAAGQSELAKTERAEIDTLRALLRAGSTQTDKPATPAKKKAAVAAEPADAPKPLLSRTQVLIGVAVLALIAVAAFFITRSSNAPDAAENKAIVVSPDDKTLGNPKASVILLEYAAPSCPHCARFNETILPKIKEEYIATGKILYILRAIPLNPTDGAVEGIARKCLPADKYFQFIDLMFRNQSKWDPDGYQITDVHGAIQQMARIMGVTPEDADRCMTDPAEQTRMNQVGKDAAVLYKVDHTPTMIINGTTVSETEMTWPAIKAKLDSLLAKK